MTDTATPETGPVDAPASLESVTAEFEAGGGNEPASALEDVTQELVNEAEGKNGDSAQEPVPEEDATDPAEDKPEPEEGNPEGADAADPFAALLATNPDLKVKIKVNGETIEVPLAELPNGYSRTEDYKAKTAAVAEERRQIEAQKASLEPTLKAQYANQLEEATNLFAQFDPVLAEARQINWDALKAQDPAAYVAAQDAVNERLTAIQRMTAQVNEARQDAQQRQEAQAQQERAQRFDKAAEEIVKQRPDLADEAKFKAFAGETVETLKGYDFTAEEIVDVLDHRVLRLADDAAKWRRHEAAQRSLPERKVIPKSAVKPLTSDGSGSSQPRPRFPGNAPRDVKGDWIARQILTEGA